MATTRIWAVKSRPDHVLDYATNPEKTANPAWSKDELQTMTEGYSESYGKTNGKYIITYHDDAGDEYKIKLDFTTEIKQPKIETEEADSKLTEKPAFQWWVMAHYI